MRSDEDRWCALLGLRSERPGWRWQHQFSRDPGVCGRNLPITAAARGNRPQHSPTVAPERTGNSKCRCGRNSNSRRLHYVERQSSPQAGKNIRRGLSSLLKNSESFPRTKKSDRKAACRHSRIGCRVCLPALELTWHPQSTLRGASPSRNHGPRKVHCHNMRRVWVLR